MSEHTNRRARREEPTAPPAATAAEAAADSGNGADTSAPTMTTEFKVEGKVVATAELARKFVAGHALTTNQAFILDVAYQRQFTNNMNANAKARAERLTKATAASDAAGIAANQPYTVEQIVTEWATYEPAVGGTPRLGSLEKLRHTAAGKAWVLTINEHNANRKAYLTPEGTMAEGYVPVITKAGANPAAFGPQRAQYATAEAYKTAQKEWLETGRDAYISRILETPWMAERVEAVYQQLLAEREAEKTASSEATTAAVSDLI